MKALMMVMALLSLSSINAQIVTDSSRFVKVLTFNIYHGETMKGDFDLDLIAKVINSVNPDLVALQEVDFKTNRVRKMDLTTELGKRTQLASVFGKAMLFDDGEYGVGILSKFSFVSTQNKPFAFYEGREPRTALESNVVLKSGDTIRFVCTHLDHSRDETMRINQALQINDRYSKDYRPTILAGDLNAKPISKAMKVLYNEWEQSFAVNTPTAPAVNPRVKIDYIMFRPANRWRVVDAYVVDEQVASDHRPVVVILEIKK